MDDENSIVSPGFNGLGQPPLTYEVEPTMLEVIGHFWIEPPPFPDTSPTAGTG
jgi:hypothetical protein